MLKWFSSFLSFEWCIGICFDSFLILLKVCLYVKNGINLWTALWFLLFRVDRAKKILSFINAHSSYLEYSFARILHIAINKGHFDLVKLLPLCGFDVNACCVNFTPPHLAVFRGHVKIIQLLLELDANVNIPVSSKPLKK